MGGAPSLELKPKETSEKQDQRTENKNEDEEQPSSPEFIPRARQSLDVSTRRSSSSEFGGRFSYESTGSASEGRSSGSSFETERRSGFLFDSARNIQVSKLSPLPEEDDSRELRHHSDDSARLPDNLDFQKDSNTAQPHQLVCQQFVTLYLQLTGKRLEDLTQQDYLLIAQLINNPQVLTQSINQPSPPQNRTPTDPYSTFSAEEQALLDAYQYPPTEETTPAEQPTNSNSSPLTSITPEEQGLLDIYQNPPREETTFFEQPSTAHSDPFTNLSPEEQALLDTYQQPLENPVVSKKESCLNPFIALSPEEQALLAAYQNPLQNPTVSQHQSCADPFTDLSPEEQALLDAYQQPSEISNYPQQAPSASNPFSTLTPEEKALLSSPHSLSSSTVQQGETSSSSSRPDQIITLTDPQPQFKIMERISQGSQPERGVASVSSSSFFASSGEPGQIEERKKESFSERSSIARSSLARSSFADEQRVVRPSMDIAGGHYTRFSGVQGTLIDEYTENRRPSEAMSFISEGSSHVGGGQQDRLLTSQPGFIPPPPPPPPPPGPPPAANSGAEMQNVNPIHERSERLKFIRSSFAAERKSIEQPKDVKDIHLFADVVDSGTIRVTADSLTSELLRRYYQLAVVPEDTPIPLTLLSMLWGTSAPVSLVDAEATAWIMEDKNIIRVVVVEDASLWCVVNSDHSSKLKNIMQSELPSMHSRLINLYRQGFHDLALVPDDNYFMHNISLHLTAAGRLTELAALLRDPIWLETKLRNYCAADVVSDFRRYFSCKEDPDLKLMLRAFQISANGSTDHPTLYILKEQMLARLIISADQSPGIRDWYDQGLSECKLAVPYRKSKSMPVHLLPKTPSLEQAGGLQRLILKGHTGGIHKVELAPNGLEVLTASSDGSIRVWDMEIGDVANKLEDHEGSVSCFALSKDGRTLVCGNEDGVGTVYELPSGIWRHKLTGHTKRINSVAIDPYCRRVVTSSQDMTTRIWSLSQGTCLHVLTDVAGAKGSTWEDWAAHHGVAISPDARIVATVDGEFYVRIWMMETATLTDVLEGHSDWVVALSFAGDCGLLLTASHDKTVRLWNLWKGFCEYVFEGHRGRINHLAVTSDGKKAVSVSDDSIGIVWNVKGHSKVCELSGHGSWINEAAITQDGSRIVTVSGDELAIVWDGDTGEPLRILNGHSGEIKSVCISYKGRFAITGSEDGTARVWDLAAPSTHLDDFHQGKVTKVLYCPNNKHVITIGEDSIALVWDIQTCKCIKIISQKSTNFNFASLAANGTLLVTASGDRSVSVWDIETGECLKTLPPHAGSRLKSIAISSDGKRALICLFDSTVSVWNLETMETVSWLMKRAERDGVHVHSAAVNEVVITNQQQQSSSAITISKDSTARIWNLDTCTTTLVLKGHEDGINLIEVKKDGNCCMTAGYDKTARVWDLTNGGECLMVLDHPHEINFLAADPYWKRAVTIAGERTAWLWDIAKGRCLGILESHGDHLSGAVFSSDGRFLATYSLNSVIRVWTASSGKLRAVYLSDSGISCCEFVGSPNIDTLVVGDGNGHVHFLEFPADELSSSKSKPKHTSSLS